MFMTVATNAFLYEPVFYWEDGYNVTQSRLMPEGCKRRCRSSPKIRKAVRS